MSGVLEGVTVAAPRPWRARLFVTASEQRLRLPRDLIGAATGAALAALGWVFVAAGVDARVTVTVPTWISWLVTGVAVGGTTAFIVAAALLCLLARRRDRAHRLGNRQLAGRRDPVGPTAGRRHLRHSPAGHPDPGGSPAHTAVDRRLRRRSGPVVRRPPGAPRRDRCGSPGRCRWGGSVIRVRDPRRRPDGDRSRRVPHPAGRAGDQPGEE